jgi:hypothetical protein
MIGATTEGVVIMRLMIDTSQMSFMVTKAPEPRRDYGKTDQKVDKGTGQPIWVLDVLAQEPDSGQVIRVSVAGEQPRVTQGQQVRVEGLEAIPWVQFDKKTSGTAFRASSVVPAAAVKAA